MYNYPMKLISCLCQLKQTLLQSISVICFILTFLFSALICWLLWLYLIIKFIKLLYIISDEFITNERIINNPYEFIHNEQLFNLCREFITLFILITVYWIYWSIDKGSEEKGSHPKYFIRNLIIWKYIANYFPIKLVLSELYNNDNIEYTYKVTGSNVTIDHRCNNISDNNNGDNNTNDENHIQSIINKRDYPINEKKLVCIKELFPANNNYLVGYHPHGILGIGAVINFLTEANQFSEKFPGITPWLTTLEINFKAPFIRDVLLSLNLIAATHRGISYLLDPQKCGNTGNFVVVVLGGAPEALDSRPGKYVFHTNGRYGFFKLALTTGSHLVPCVSFGEPNMFKQVHNPEGSYIRYFQNRFTKMATFSPPLFYAHWLLPYRANVNTVIGRPIYCEKNTNPTREQVSMLKELYLKELQNLYNKYKPIYDPNGDLTMI
ncbi:2-acylglycerol O-acyltransferase 2-A isoform 2 [Schistosoma japonicum]|uniref:Acyltransferase n=3 Tax=Schistosoma japonicum TaxID=6182 RepID=A0A4Z2CN23_SCHJA|nr:2-acylglycerol O-acyltransferase 2 [Schistosoma japonicum]TNN05625.1 2-acylglycerol O-acyltransferase 2-A isoform 2 [Schistosoma japonicum]